MFKGITEDFWQIFKKCGRQVAGLFVKNFEKYADGVSAEVLAAAPKV